MVCFVQIYRFVGLAKWLPRPTPNRKILGSSPRFDNLSFSFCCPGIMLAWHCYVLVVFLNLVVVFYTVKNNIEFQFKNGSKLFAFTPPRLMVSVAEFQRKH